MGTVGGRRLAVLSGVIAFLSRAAARRELRENELVKKCYLGV